MLAHKAGYTIGSRELATVFLRGLDNAGDVVEQVIDKSPTDYYDLKEKAIAVVKNQQLLRTLRNNANLTPTFRPFTRPNQSNTPRFNSSNAPRWMNNTPVPMDLLRGRTPPHRNSQGQWRQNRMQGNAAQLEEPPKRNQNQCIHRCYNCDKPGHFARDCRANKNERSYNRRAFVEDYIDKEEDMSGLQPAIHPTNLLDNALKVFDTLPPEQKDALINQYEGKREDFVAA
jgi:hypothetical protein